VPPDFNPQKPPRSQPDRGGFIYCVGQRQENRGRRIAGLSRSGSLARRRVAQRRDPKPGREAASPLPPRRDRAQLFAGAGLRARHLRGGQVQAGHVGRPVVGQLALAQVERASKSHAPVELAQQRAVGLPILRSSDRRWRDLGGPFRPSPAGAASGGWPADAGWRARPAWRSAHVSDGNTDMQSAWLGILRNPWCPAHTGRADWHRAFAYAICFRPDPLARAVIRDTPPQPDVFHASPQQVQSDSRLRLPNRTAPTATIPKRRDAPGVGWAFSPRKRTRFGR